MISIISGNGASSCGNSTSNLIQILHDIVQLYR